VCVCVCGVWMCVWLSTYAESEGLSIQFRGPVMVTRGDIMC
jgi:hypothetical protein